MILIFLSAASAAVLTFDDLTPTSSYANVPNGYGGLDWTNMGYLNSGSSIYTGSGYDLGRVSGDYVAFNKGGMTAQISDGSFDFNDAYFTAAWNNGLNIHAQGLLGGTLVYDVTFQVDYDNPYWLNANFIGIDELVFDSYGGTNIGLNGIGTQFAMDNFTYNESAPVPEPATMLLLGAGLIGLAAVNRKKLIEK
jgi:PEP-CTERM motif